MLLHSAPLTDAWVHGGAVMVDNDSYQDFTEEWYAEAHGGWYSGGSAWMRPWLMSQWLGGVGDGESWEEAYVSHWLWHCGTMLGS